ncbi:MAG: peptidoglycan-binding protein [Alphaproteobacteria bacterium]|nr:peptidoglycan-binding protein [Alphaproteobacteria bacterium]
MNSPIIGGALESTIDYRDGIATVSAPTVPPTTLPASYQTDFSPFGVYNQVNEPSCVSHAWAELMKLWWYREHGEIVNFSPRFLDILSAEPDIPLNGGRRPRTVAKISATFGCARTATVPNDTSLPIAQYRDPSVITPAAKAEALKYRIPGYLAAPLDLKGLRTYTQLYGAVSVLMQIGAEWYTPDWADKDIDPLRVPQTVIGGHQTLTKGWVDFDKNTLRNSWSDQWANKGEANYSWSAWRPYMLEGWTIAELPTDLKDFLANLPAPSAFHYQWNHNLAYGDDNDDVKWLQCVLMILGFLPPIPADELGIFGSKTAAAVGEYQVSKGIFPALDSVGPQTRAKLNTEFPISN